jgi:hypothetical protein
MENAVAFRKLTNEFMARVRNEMQSPSRDDIDTVMLTVRHMEKRLLDRMDELSQQLEQLKARAGGDKVRKPVSKKDQPGKRSPGRRTTSREVA